MANAVRSIVAATGTGTTTTATFTETPALDTTNGFVAFVRQFNATPPTTPSGWTLLPGSGVQGTLWTGVYARRGDGTVNSISIVGPDTSRVIVLLAYANINQDIFWETPSGNTGASVTSLSAGTVTTTIDNSQAVAFAAVSGTAGGAGFTWSNSFIQRSGSSSSSSTSWAELGIALSGTGATTTATWTSAFNARTILVVLRTNPTSVFGYVLESDMTTLTPVGIAGVLDADLVTVHPVSTTFEEYSDTPPSSRVYAMHPFTSTSIWNIPIHTGVTYTTGSDARTATFSGLVGNMNYDADWNLAIWQATGGSPQVTIQAPRFSYPTWPSGGATFQVPSSGVVPGPDGDGSYNVQYDGWVTIISPDGTTAVDLYKAKWITVGVTLQADFAYQYPLDCAGGTEAAVGTAPGDGLKASNWMYMGGIVRTWEMSNTSVAASERIKHAITVSIPNGALLAGYVWPARGQDSDSGSYSGDIPMGTCFALPPSFDIENNGLTDHGKALAYALQNYGAWIGDRGGSAGVAVMYTEMNTGVTLGGAYKTALQTLLPYMVAIDGRSSTNPGGTGTPRVPLTPEGTFGPIT